MKLSALLVGSAVALLGAFCHDAHAQVLNPIAIKGYKMFDAKTGEYFMVKGVDYYPRPNAGELNVNNYDFFSDDHEDVWSQDLAYLKELGANAVRLYAVDPTVSHDKFMCALRAQGMYALIDMGASCLGCHITTDEAPACYSGELKSRGQQIIGAFAKYDNVLAFSAGNEINNDPTMKDFDNAPCQKRFVRDLREYIHECGMRHIPVGVVMSDRDRMINAQYYNCRTGPDDEFETVEWYGINVYLYCDAKVTKPSGGFAKLLTDFADMNPAAPILVTEYGCLNPSFPTVDGYDAQRTWTQAGWLYTKEFRDVFNGGFVFEYSTERANSKKDADYPFTSYGKQNYGLGYFSPEDCDHDKTKCKYNKMPNFDNLAKQYNSTDASDESKMAKFSPSSARSSPTKCPIEIKGLKGLDWSNSTDTKSLDCPPKEEFVCPGQKSSGKWFVGASSGSSSSSRAMTGSSKGSKPTKSSTSSKSGGDAKKATDSQAPATNNKSAAVIASVSWTVGLVAALATISAL
ncbi:TPA: hypothetical protein N0F65_000945 [Lagenidium giganteum]|uniref:Glycoside hydrolase n=1 Tax=Lagenidium giganteum TaxID=4803 RepID=A0AAV2YKP4_9STRA|nr:TPA: hypothetical protein N0F65_000945 [Lagenidium giganteum]